MGGWVGYVWEHPATPMPPASSRPQLRPEEERGGRAGWCRGNNERISSTLVKRTRHTFKGVPCFISRNCWLPTRCAGQVT